MGIAKVTVDHLGVHLTTTVRSVLLLPKTPFSGDRLLRNRVSFLTSYDLSAWFAPTLAVRDLGRAPSATRRGHSLEPTVTERPLHEFIAASNKLWALSTQNRRPGRLRIEAFRGVAGFDWSRLLRQRQGSGIVKGRGQS